MSQGTQSRLSSPSWSALNASAVALLAIWSRGLENVSSKLDAIFRLSALTLSVTSTTSSSNVFVVGAATDFLLSKDHCSSFLVLHWINSLLNHSLNRQPINRTWLLLYYPRLKKTQYTYGLIKSQKSNPKCKTWKTFIFVI